MTSCVVRRVRSHFEGLMHRISVALAVVLMSALVSSAEIYVLRSGKEVDGSVLRTNADGTVTLKTRSGVQTYSVTEFSDATGDRHFADVRPTVPVQATDRSRSAETRPPGRKPPLEFKHAGRHTVIGLAVAGVVTFLIGWLWMIVAGFAESPVWGIAFILSAGIAEMAFIFTNWERAKRPLFFQILGLALLLSALWAAR